MSVASKNPFAILDDEVSSRPASPPPGPKSTPGPQAPPAATRNQPKTRGGPASRGGKYYARGGKPSASADSAAPAGDEPAVDGKKVEGARGGRGGRSRGRGGNAGGRGRQYDRHSATGKTDSNKKVHQGWGGDEGSSELKNEEQAAADAAAEPTAEGAAEGEAVPAPEGDAKADSKPRREREVEEEDNTLTLDQYLAQQKEKDAIVPKIEAVRQANEGAGDDLWNGAVALAKDEEEAYFVGKQKSAPKSKAKKEEKVYLEIEGRFERPDRGGARGGRGRGGDRGGERRGRGAPRGGRGQRQNGATAQAPNVDDQSAFPSLS